MSAKVASQDFGSGACGFSSAQSKAAESSLQASGFADKSAAASVPSSCRSSLTCSRPRARVLAKGLPFVEEIPLLGLFASRFVGHGLGFGLLPGSGEVLGQSRAGLVVTARRVPSLLQVDDGLSDLREYLVLPRDAEAMWESCVPMSFVANLYAALDAIHGIRRGKY